MNPAIRTPIDGRNDQYSIQTGLTCTPEEDRARQEDAHAADINNILSRYGIGLNQKQPIWGTEVDQNLDLQQALSAIAEAKHAWRNLPENLRMRYPSWQQLLNAIDAGQLKINLQDPPAEPPAP